MTDLRRLRLRDHLRPGAHFYLERQHLPSRVGREPQLHRHDFLELYWVESGRGREHRLDGQRKLEAGRMVLLGVEDAHALEAEGDAPLVFWNLAFPVADWRSLCQRHAGELPDRFAGALEARWLRLRPQELEALGHWAAALAAGGRLRLDLERLLLDLDHLLGVGPRNEVGSVPDWLLTALAAVRQPRWFVLGPRAFVRLSGRSAAHVARCVRRHCGTTPTAVINEARLSWAAGRLAGSADTITDICLSCGWSSLGCFYRTFRRRFGTTPQEWRRRAMGIA